MLNVLIRIILFLCVNQTYYAMKTLLIIISTLTLLLFTSCEKDEMDKGGFGGGGGMENSLKSEEDSTFIVPENDTITTVCPTIEEQSKSE